MKTLEQRFRKVIQENIDPFACTDTGEGMQFSVESVDVDILLKELLKEVERFIKENTEYRDVEASSPTMNYRTSFKAKDVFIGLNNLGDK